MQAPRTPHLHAVHHLLQYLKSAPGQGLFFPASNQLDLTAYADADWGSCLDTRRSTTGFSVFRGNSLLSWKSKKQPTVSKSSTEAEYCTLSSVASELVWLTRLLTHSEIQISSTMVFCDNQSAIHLASNPAPHERSKHIDIDYHFIRELVQSKLIKLIHVKSQHQIADLFTKALPYPQFSSLIPKLGIHNIYSPPLRGGREVLGQDAKLVFLLIQLLLAVTDWLVG